MIGTMPLDSSKAFGLTKHTLSSTVQYPQTWESPNFPHEFTEENGDNDPMDLFDIGSELGYIGQVKTVKILGALAVNDVSRLSRNSVKD
jgi:inorganic pyrophosphatase